MAEEQDAARDRVLTARAALDQELTTLQGSVRAAVDIPAKVRQSPVKVAAVAAGIGFVLLRGPQRLWSAFRQAVFGRRAPMPERMLPDEIEKTLAKMGDDGEKVRGTLERDFAEYVKKAEKRRGIGLIPIVVLAFARPMLALAGRRLTEYLFSQNPEGTGTRFDELRAKAALKSRGGQGPGRRQGRRGGGDGRAGRPHRLGTHGRRRDESPPSGQGSPTRV